MRDREVNLSGIDDLCVSIWINDREILRKYVYTHQLIRPGHVYIVVPRINSKERERLDKFMELDWNDVEIEFIMNMSVVRCGVYVCKQRTNMKNVQLKPLLSMNAPTTSLKRRKIASPPNEPPTKSMGKLNACGIRWSGWMVVIACSKQRSHGRVGWKSLVTIFFNDHQLGHWRMNIASKLEGSLTALRNARKRINSSQEEIIQDPHCHMITIMLQEKSHKEILEGSLTPPSHVQDQVTDIVKWINTFKDCTIIANSV